MAAIHPINEDSPFHLDSDDAYRRWREGKLTDYPTGASSLIVPISDPREGLSPEQHGEILTRLRKTNMAVYDAGLGSDADKAIPRLLGERFGLVHLDANLLSDDDGITSITVNPEGDHPRYIPYTNRPISWHCDGYYNPEDRQIRGMLLHCVQNAAEGGENALLDHEIVYILLRDENPDYVRAMMQPDMMSIPPGKDSEGGERDASVGPVFSVEPDTGALHMRYTARKRNIAWKGDALSVDAREYLEAILADENLPYVFEALLRPGMGLICNNVLHTRRPFRDGEAAPQRLLYRARYFDRAAGTW